ncbi:YidB family protein [Dechloromonas agitata]|uniref:YidB family protein n=1 Tax=Dechloromonas agitata TaxID=73030 RepID=UPI00237D7E67|nr:YidB family protein [Dechloromonas agitata]MDE1546303.1 YidB family protein [Dechloromonas agitata]
MGLLDSVVGSLTAGNTPGGTGLLEAVIQLIQNQPGGLAGLVQSFQQGGLAEIVNSWVSTGQNLPVSGQQLASVLGSGPLQGMAAQLGLSPDQVAGSLADLLPQVVDQLTPNGQLPQGGDLLLAQGMDLLKKGGLFG